MVSGNERFAQKLLLPSSFKKTEEGNGEGASPPVRQEIKTLFAEKGETKNKIVRTQGKNQERYRNQIATHLNTRGAYAD